MKSGGWIGGRAGMAIVGLVAAILLPACPPTRLSAQDSFPPKPPQPTRLLPARFPPYEEARLPNGIDLIVVERHQVPVVSVSLSFRAGGVYDPPGREGLSELVADVLTKGTTTRSAEDLATAIEGVGGRLSARSGDDFLTISTNALSDQLALVFNLLGDVILHATFPTSEFELARTRELSSLMLALSQPGTLAARFFGAEIYGSNPYGRSPTEASYKAISREDVIEFARTRLRSGGALLVVAGDVTRPQVEALVSTAFAGWAGDPPPAPAPVTAPTRRGTDILLVHRPGSVQSVIMVGNTTMLPTDPQHYAARVVTHVLGGGADSRLFRVLRERESWTYDIDAGMHRYRGLGYWSATAQVRTEATDSALRELLHQIRQIRTEPIPPAELAAAKGFLVGSFPLSIETSGHIASQVATVKLLGLDVDYLRLYRERLNAVTAPSARLAAQRLFHVDALTIVVAGDGAKLYDRLKAIAPVRIVDAEGHAALAPQSGRLPLDPTQVRLGRDSFTVLVQGTPVGTRTTVLRRTRDSLVFTESLTVQPEAATVITALLDPTDLTTKALDQSGTAGGQRSEMHLRFAAGRVKGHAVLPQPGGSPVEITIDTTAASGPYYTEFASNVVIRALPLRPMATFSIPVFSVGDRSVRTLNVQVSGVDSVKVPAGTFRAFKVMMSGGEIPIAYYVSEGSPRRILKVEILETPVAFELVR
jgi:predicted Zn-dependent peptidase